MKISLKKLTAAIFAFSLLSATSVSLALIGSTDTNFKNQVNDAMKIAQDLRNFKDKYYIKEGENVEEITNKAILEVGNYVKGLNAQNKIKSFEISDKSVLFKHNSGISFVFSPYVENTRGDKAPKYALNYMNVVTYQPFATEMSTHTDDKIPLPVDVPSEDKYTQVAGSKLSTAFEHISYTTENTFIDTTLSKDILSKMGPNQVILFQGHGTWIQGLHSTIVTNRDFQWGLYQTDPEYRKDVDDSLIAFDGYNEVLTYKYIDKYVGDLTNSFVYLGLCQSAMDSVLANTFLMHNAAAVIGNTETTNVRYNDAVTYEVCSSLATLKEDDSSYTLEEALNIAKEKYGESDGVKYPTPGKPGSVPTIFGDKTFQITHPKIVPYVNINLIYNGQEQFPMENGVGYIRMGDLGAYDHYDGGEYQVDARLDVANGYVWPDGSNTEWLHFGWNIAKHMTKLDDISVPTAKTGLMYTGKSLTLINAGESEFGTFEYQVDDGYWGEELPKVTSAGKHTVRWVFYGDKNHTDIGKQNIPMTIEVNIANNPVNTGTIIVSVLLIVLFVGAIVVLVLLSRKRNRQEEAYISELEAKQEKENERAAKEEAEEKETTKKE